jgi:hypothetical protein
MIPWHSGCKPELKMLKWLRYSGASVIITVNPCHWRLRPGWGQDREWPNEGTVYVTWLFLTVRIWIDDGSW